MVVLRPFFIDFMDGKFGQFANAPDQHPLPRFINDAYWQFERGQAGTCGAFQFGHKQLSNINNRLPKEM